MSVPLILVHGGAGDIPDSRVQGKLDGVRRAVREAYKKYDETKSILDASQAAVEYMETDANFNAGLHTINYSQKRIPVYFLLKLRHYYRLRICFEFGWRNRIGSVSRRRKIHESWYRNLAISSMLK